MKEDKTIPFGGDMAEWVGRLNERNQRLMSTRFCAPFYRRIIQFICDEEGGASDAEILAHLRSTVRYLEEAGSFYE